MKPKSASSKFSAHALVCLLFLVFGVWSVPGLSQNLSPETPEDGTANRKDSLPDYPGKDLVPVKDWNALVDTSMLLDQEADSFGNPGKSSGAIGSAPRVGGTADSVDARAALPKAETEVPAGGLAAEKGIVLSAETGKPLPQAIVLLIGGTDRYSVTSDKDGLYFLSGVKPGIYRLKAGKKGFAWHEREGVEFRTGDGPLREIRLERSVLKGQTIEAKGRGIAGSGASLMAARRSASGVMEGVGAEQMAKSADADAGAVAKRITGTSLVGGKYIYVRGLGERYTNMTLNGLPVPSPEKDKRVVPQDLFPASALERFILYKSFSPELYGDFAGGSVALETKGIPEKRFFKVSAGQGGTDYSGNGAFLGYGEDRLTYEGGNTFWGFDDGTRARPKGVPGVIVIREDKDIPGLRAQGLSAPTREERAAYALSFNNTYSLDTATVRPNRNYSVSLGDVRQDGDGGRAGWILSAGFKNSYRQRERTQWILGLVPIRHDVYEFVPILGKEVKRSVILEDTLPEMRKANVNGRDTMVHATVPVTRLAPGIRRDMRSGTYEATLTGLADFGWDIGTDHRLFWKNFFVNLGADEAAYTVSRVDSSGALNQDRPVEERYLLEFSRRSLASSQLGGGHYLGLGPLDSASWAAGFSRTEGETPDSRKYLYSRESDSAPSFENTNNDVWGTRIYENLRENAWAGRADVFLAIPPAWSARDTFFTDGKAFSRLRLPESRAGISAGLRDRDFGATRYAYDKDRNIYVNRTLEQIREPRNLKAQIEQKITDFYTSPKDHDEYQAQEGTYAGYLSAASGFRLFRVPMDIEAGARIEYYRLNLLSPFTGPSLATQREIDSAAVRLNRRRADLLPSAGLTVEPWRGSKVHLHYARTLTRPEFREIAPYTYYDYLTGRDVKGEPGLKQTSISHADLRWDWFLPGQQLLSVSLFHKRFLDPIEVTADVDKRMSFQNAESGYVRGVELEANFGLDPLLSGLGPLPALLRGWTCYGNLALMRSRVALDTAQPSARDLTSKTRGMVGQSPYLLNVKVTHEGEWRGSGLLNALLFNLAGERIREVGVGGAPDIYELPFPSFDYLGRLVLYRKLELSWGAKNLLGRNRRYRGYEYNQDKAYHTLSPEQVRALYRDRPTGYGTEVSQEGTTYEMKIGYGI